MSDDKQARRIERAQKIQRWIDPAAAANQTSVLDAAGGATGRLREANRDNEALRQGDTIVAATDHTARMMDALLAEQQHTNALLRELIDTLRAR